VSILGRKDSLSFRVLFESYPVLTGDWDLCFPSTTPTWPPSVPFSAISTVDPEEEEVGEGKELEKDAEEGEK
jgi:hypothetical protein